VRDPAFTSEPFSVHTRWIETEWAGGVEPYAASSGAPEGAEDKQTVVVEVAGKRLEVAIYGGTGLAAPASPSAAPRRRGAGKKSTAAASGDALTSPMQGTIVKIAVAEGDTVAAGDLVVVLEAMKMEQPLNAHKAGVVTGLAAAVGDVVSPGATICELK
jgi:acetyl-CoA/propionyl-CoA carboxylase, biotin carboxylase, biotin carboxyl carrier protein